MAETPKFEEGLAELEKLVTEMEAGELGLDEALKRFEKGVQLAGRLQKALEDTHRKVEQLSLEGAPDAAPEGEAGGPGGEGEDAAPAPAAKRSRGAKGASAGPTLF